MNDSQPTKNRATDDETSVYTVVMQPPPPAPPAQVLPAGGNAPPVAGPALGSPAIAPGPSPPAPGPAMPLYPAQEQGVYHRPAPARAPYGTTARAVFGGVVLLVFGLAEIIGGAAGVVIASSLKRVFDQLLRDEGLRIDAAALVSVLTGIFVGMLLLGIVHTVASLGVFAHRRWGRWLGVGLGMVGVVAGAWLVYRAIGSEGLRSAALVGPLAILVPYVVTLLALLYPGEHFRRRGRSA